MLQVWLPLNGDLHNQGLSQVNTSGGIIDNSGKIGKCYKTKNTNQLTITENLETTSEFSIAFWLKIPSTFESSSGWEQIFNYPIIAESDGTVGAATFYLSSTSPRKLRIYDNNNYWATYNPDFGNWQHITIVHTAINNGNGTKITVYFNGIQVGSNNYTQHPLKIKDGSISFGYKTYTDYFYLNDVRIYDHCLSATEVAEIAKGLVLHYKLDGETVLPGNPNLGNTSANFSNMNKGQQYSASGWGGGAGTVFYYSSGGYNNLPYKVYHKTSTSADGGGGIYKKTADDITLVEGKTYTMSCWIKASQNFSASHYSFNINRGSDNKYITYGNNFAITTDWKFFKKTFTVTSSDAGSYGEMSITYNSNVGDVYVYYSGFKIEEGEQATTWTDPSATLTTIYDSSGYSNNGTISGSLSAAAGSPRYDVATVFPGTAYSKCVSPSSEAKTFSVWAKWDSIPSGQSVIYVDQKSKTGLGLMSAGILCSSCGLSSYTFSKSNIVANTWYHFVVICPNGPADATRKLYINGVEQTATSNTSNWSYALDELQVGKRSTTSDGFSGQLSDFRIYATALTAEQVADLYRTSMSIDSSGNIHARELKEV